MDHAKLIELIPGGLGQIFVGGSGVQVESLAAAGRRNDGVEAVDRIDIELLGVTRVPARGAYLVIEILLVDHRGGILVALAQAGAILEVEQVSPVENGEAT